MIARPGSVVRATRNGIVWLLLALAPAEAGGLRPHVAASGRALLVESRAGWIDGGFGRLTEGHDPGRFVARARGEVHAGLDWEPSPTWLVRVHGTARAEPGAAGGSRAGLAEAFLQYRPEIRPSLALRFRGGLLFPPTSRENVDPLWQSPYTLTLSAANAWIGEEVRPLGLDAAVQLGGGASRLELAAMAFGGSDTAGTLVAWRGWSMHSRLSVVGETLPLPPLPTLAPGGGFGGQRPDGTRPIDELDGRVGWHARGRWSYAGAALVQAAYTDTRGDRELHAGQYAWETRFAALGLELERGPLRLVAEGMAGDTGMGATSGPHVDTRFRAGYVLLSWAAAETLRLSTRVDGFRNRDRDHGWEPNGESGWAVAVAAFYTPRPHLRLGLEYLDLRSDRPAAAFSGTVGNTDAKRAQAELRVRF
jgi:hypothetical protein